jgi:hypothetical protein
MDRKLIEQYAEGSNKVALAIRGLTHEDMLCRPAPDANVGKWSVQEVVVHLADCEGVFADRIKRVIAEDNPTLLAFDENKWASALAYGDRSPEDAAALIELTRKQVASILQRLPDAAFQRTGTHSEAGKLTLEAIVKKASDHLEHHLHFIHLKRAKWGKEMW